MSTAIERVFGLHIDGESEAGTGRRMPVGEPATGEPLADVRLATQADVDRAVDSARAALAGPWGKTPATERSRLLHALADLVRANRAELAELEARNVGKAIGSVKAEIAAGIETLRFYASVAAATSGSTGTLGGSLTHYSLKQPVGVCAQVVPWNYPFMLTAWKLGPALAAGCTVVLKPDPRTPLTAVRLAELAAEAGIPAGVVNVLPAEPNVAAGLVRHPGVDKVAFTGSTATGGEIMRLCSEPLKRLTLELGGKSPSIVFADADLDEAVPAAVWSIFASAGQSCEARSRLLVERPVHDEVVARFTEAAGRLVVGDPLDAATQVGSLISQEHRRRVHRYVERAAAEGAQLVLGGEPAEGPGAFYPPTVLTGVEAGSEAAQEEIFGPVVTVTPFDGEEEAVAIANGVRYGLMATVWTGDPKRGARLARRIDAGTIGLNTPYTAFPGVAFGGFKQSGFGRELGAGALDDYLEEKSVLVASGARPANPFGL
jgi:acyl-CoA reductase-like NAD-dependent aldehyde dehydrogenase